MFGYLLALTLETKNFLCKHDVECNKMAEAIYHEARGEPIVGQRAVAYVILNRVNKKRWPDTVSEVIEQPRQFSYLFDGSVERGMTDRKARRKARMVAFNVLYGFKPSPVGSATHYFNPNKANPMWQHKLTHVADIGNHSFYE